MHLARFIGPLPMILAKRKSASSSTSRGWRAAGGSGRAKPREGGHAPPRAPALDRDDQIAAFELGLAEIRAVGHLVVHLAAVACPAVARLAISLLQEKPHALGDVGRTGILCLHARCDQQPDDEPDACLRSHGAACSKRVQPGRIVHEDLLAGRRVGRPQRKLVQHQPVVNLEERRQLRRLAPRA